LPNARYYVAEIGRFASADTIVPDPLNPQSFNRYAYVLNNPLKFADPSGHCAEFGDDGCWSTYDQIVNACPECAQMQRPWLGGYRALYQENGIYLQAILESVNGGWRPPPGASLSPSSLSYETWAAIADAAGYLELGLDAYNVAHTLLSGATEDRIPGPVGVGLIMVRVGIENQDASLQRVGFEMAWAVGTDMVVDAGITAVASYAGVKTIAAVGTVTGGPIGAVVGAGVGALVFVAGQAGYDLCCSQTVDRFGDRTYESLVYTSPYVTSPYTGQLATRSPYGYYSAINRSPGPHAFGTPPAP
jgi:hypothetical protein